MKLIHILLLLFFATFASSTIAKDNKDEPYFDNYSTFLKLENKKGKLTARSLYDFTISYPTDLSAKYLSSYTIYLSSYDKVIGYEVSLIDSKGREDAMPNLDVQESENNSDEYFVTGTKEVKLNFSGLEAGVKVRVSYLVETSELHFFQPYYFRHVLKCLNSRYRVFIPKDVQVRLVKKNFDSQNIQSNKSEQNGGTMIEFLSGKSDAIEYHSDGPSVPYYTALVLPILEKYANKGEIENYLSSPTDLYEYYNSIVYKSGFATSSELEDVAADIKSKSTSTIDIIKNTYHWVQKNVRYIAYEAGADGVIPRAPELVCSRKFGDCKDMSNLIRKLLELNQVNSNLTWVGTRSIPYTYEDVYTMNTDNHMIASVKQGEDWVFLDATDPNGLYGLPTTHIQGKQCMIAIDPENFELVDIPIIPADSNRIDYHIKLSIDEDNMDMDCKLAGYGYAAGSIKNLLLYSSEKDMKDLMKGLVNTNSNKTEVVDYSMDLKQEDRALIDCQYILGGRIKQISGDIIFNPFVNKVLPFGSVDLEDRTVDVEIRYNQFLKNNINVQIPAGYMVNNLPDDISFKNENFDYRFTVKNTGKDITFQEVIKVQSPDLFISLDSIKEWNKLVTQVKKLYNTSIKLSKSN